MELKDSLIAKLDSLGLIRFSNSFGWICIYTGKNMFGGYKAVDSNILILFLILSPEGFKNSQNEGFLKFEFGQTWAETEINNQEDLPRIAPYLKDAFEYSQIRKEMKLKKLK